MEGLVLCWIGEKDAQAGLIETVRAHLGSELRVKVATGFEPERPGEAWDARRHQYETGRILKWLESRHAGAAKVLGFDRKTLYRKLQGYGAAAETADQAPGRGEPAARGNLPRRPPKPS